MREENDFFKVLLADMERCKRVSLRFLYKRSEKLFNTRVHLLYFKGRVMKKKVVRHQSDFNQGCCAAQLPVCVSQMAGRDSEAEEARCLKDCPVHQPRALTSVPVSVKCVVLIVTHSL